MKHIKHFEVAVHNPSLRIDKINLRILYDYLVKKGFDIVLTEGEKDETAWISSNDYNYSLCMNEYGDVNIYYSEREDDKLSHRYVDFRGIAKFLKKIELREDAKKYNL